MVKEIKAFETRDWKEVIVNGEVETRSRYESGECDKLSGLLYAAAVGKECGVSIPSLATITECDMERLGQYKDFSKVLFAAGSNANRGFAKVMIHGQTIEIAWNLPKPENHYYGVEVRVKNPTLETFMAIPFDQLRKMRFQSASGEYYMGRNFLGQLG